MKLTKFTRTKIEQEDGMTRSMKLILFIGLPLIAVTALLVPQFSVDKVVSASMESTIKTGDNILNTSLFKNNVNRGDIIAFKDGYGWFANQYTPNANGEIIVMKRVIAVGGDTVSSDGINVYVNGEALDEPYAYGETKAFTEQLIPPRTLFVMGDNRSESADSRKHLNDGKAFIPLGWVTGHYVMTLWNDPVKTSDVLCREGFLDEC